MNKPEKKNTHDYECYCELCHQETGRNNVCDEWELYVKDLLKEIERIGKELCETRNYD